MQMTLREIENITGGRLVGADVTVSAVTIDSRTAADGALYVAICGDRFDGHDFCAYAGQNGYPMRKSRMFWWTVRAKHFWILQICTAGIARM